MPPTKKLKIKGQPPGLTQREHREKVIQAVWDKLNSIHDALHKNKLTEAINLLTNLRRSTQELIADQTVFFNKLMLTHINECLNTNKLYEARLLLNEAGLFLKNKPASMSLTQEEYWEHIENSYLGKYRNLSRKSKSPNFQPIREDKVEVDLFSWLNSGKSDIELAETLVLFIKQQALPHSLFVPLIINTPSSAHNSPETILSFEEKLRDIINKLNEIKKERTEPSEQHSIIHANFIVKTILKQWILQQKKMESSIGNEASLFKPATKSEGMASSNS